MGFLDEVKGKAAELGEKAGDAFEAAKDKASDLVEDIKEKFDKDDADAAETDTTTTSETAPTGDVAEPAGIGEDPTGTDDLGGDLGQPADTPPVGAVPEDSYMGADTVDVPADDPLVETTDSTEPAPTDGSEQGGDLRSNP